jgi:APA family basic amino acid/polyamine antiporter
MVRPFRAPAYKLVSALGVIICAGMIVAIDSQTLKFAFVWMIIGLVVYFLYSKKHSKKVPHMRDFFVYSH